MMELACVHIHELQGVLNNRILFQRLQLASATRHINVYIGFRVGFLRWQTRVIFGHLTYLSRDGCRSVPQKLNNL